MSTYRPGPYAVRRRRPSPWWFALGAALLVGAVVSGAGLLFWTLSSFTATDVTLPADGTTQEFTVPTDEQRMLWSEQDQPPLRCSIIDGGTGEPILFQSPGGSFTKTSDGGEWVATDRFAPGSGALEVTCDNTGGRLQIGPAPEIGSFVGGIFATILIPLFLGGAGLVLMIVLTVLYATGAPREAPTA